MECSCGTPGIFHKVQSESSIKCKVFTIGKHGVTISPWGSAGALPYIQILYTQKTPDDQSRV